MASSTLTSFLGALQASLAVLLTICYGAIAAQFKLLSESSAREISTTCVRLFLPALLICNVGSQLHLATAARYVPVLVYSITYNVLSMALGIASTKLFNLPSWVTPALAFNNTTSLPLLLVQSLETTGILSSLLGEGESSSDAIDRAKSYFLINAMVSNSLTFALGPRLLNGHNEDAPHRDNDNTKSDTDPETASNDSNSTISTEDRPGNTPDDSSDPDEQTSLLPNRMVAETTRLQHAVSRHSHKQWSRLSPQAQSSLNFIYLFVNAPFIGALLGVLLGLTPALHKAFFSNTQNGGIFRAWLMASIKNIGDLFATLQIIVVGVKLAHALQRMKQGKAAGSLPWKSFAFITAVRFVLWPLISIPLIWCLATRTSVLSDDPVLWFAMMLMPTGPPAMKLTALADVNDSDEQEKMSIAKFLTVSYAMSPLICFSVVGSLKASEAALGR